MKLPFYIHIPCPFSAIEMSENGFALGQNFVLAKLIFAEKA